MTSRAGNEKSRRTRKSPGERRAEILRAAVDIALSDGLEAVTLRSVSEAQGITIGLVGHYYPAVDELLAEAFTTVAQGEIDELFTHAQAEADPVETMRSLLRQLLAVERGPVSLLWIDAWHAGRRRPPLLAAVSRLMVTWLEEVATVIEDGRAAGAFRNDDAMASATRIMSVVDGLIVNAAMRDAIDNSPVRGLVTSLAEQELGLPPATLAPGS